MPQQQKILTAEVKDGVLTFQEAAIKFRTTKKH